MGRHIELKDRLLSLIKVALVDHSNNPIQLYAQYIYGVRMKKFVPRDGGAEPKADGLSSHEKVSVSSHCTLAMTIEMEICHKSDTHDYTAPHG